MFTFEYLNKKNYLRMLIIGQQWGGVHTIQRDRCDATRWPNLAFHHLPRCVTVSFSTRSGACLLMVLRLLSMIVCFPPLLFSLLTDKIIFILFVFCFLISVLIILISYFVLIPFIDFFCF